MTCSDGVSPAFSSAWVSRSDSSSSRSASWSSTAVRELTGRPPSPACTVAQVPCTAPSRSPKVGCDRLRASTDRLWSTWVTESASSAREPATSTPAAASA